MGREKRENAGRVAIFDYASYTVSTVHSMEGHDRGYWNRRTSDFIGARVRKLRHAGAPSLSEHERSSVPSLEGDYPCIGMLVSTAELEKYHLGAQKLRA